MPWSDVAPGLRQKACDFGGNRFRIVEFSQDFVEPDWCLKGHDGYILSGEIIVNIDGELTSFGQGQAIHLPAGLRHRHHATVSTATLFLIEPLDSDTACGDEGC